MSLLLLSLVFILGLAAGILIGIKHAARGQAIKDAVKKG